MSDADPRVREVLARFRRLGTARNREGMARFAITAQHVFGVPLAKIRSEAKRLGHDHALALALWDTGWQDARILAVFVDEPARVTQAQMDRWARDFENWAVCDGACIHLFDRAPGAWTQVRHFAARKGEFERRAAFAMLAAMANHRKREPDDAFINALGLVRAAASDDRNFVKKAVNWALRAIGNRSALTYIAALALARQLAASGNATERWVGRDAERDLMRPLVRARLARRASAAARAKSTRERRR